METTKRTRKNGQRLTRFTITINNWKEEELATAKIWIARYARWGILGKEHEDDGTPHIQGAVCLKNPMAFTTIKGAFPRAHIELMKGTPLSNQLYL